MMTNRTKFHLDGEPTTLRQEITNNLRQEQDLVIYDSMYVTGVTNSTILTGIENLPSILVENNILKADRKLIQINQFAIGSRLLKDAYLPYNIIIDIDFKDEQQINYFLKDTNTTTLELGLKKVLKQLSEDEYCLMASLSQSGKGIKAIYQIVSDYYFTNYSTYELGNDSIIRRIMDKNYSIIKDRLKVKYNLNEYIVNNKEEGYLDPSAVKVGQGLCTLNDVYHFNIDSKIYYYNWTGEQLTPKTLGNNNTITREDLVIMNDNYVADLLQYLHSLNTLSYIDSKTMSTSKNITEYNQVFSVLKQKFTQWTESMNIFFSLRYLSEGNIENMYKLISILYQECKKDENKPYYLSTGYKHLKSLSAFNIFLLRLNDTYKTPISNYFRDVYSNNPLNNTGYNSDFFNIEYDEKLGYTNYISEHKERLYELFTTEQLLVLKAPAGGGKTTFILNHFLNMLISGEYNRVSFVSPKNALLTQVEELLKGKMEYSEDDTEEIKEIKAMIKKSGIQVVRNYGKGIRYSSELYTENDKLIILSSTPKIEQLVDVDLIVLDEVHNFVSYSQHIQSNININQRIIFISATPEKYLINTLKNYYYINLYRIGGKKKEITKIISKHHVKSLKKILDKDRKQLVFLNNKQLSKDVADEFPEIDFHFINSDLGKTPEVLNILHKQELTHTHYMATSYISDGINFNNTVWDDLIIVESGIIDHFEIYQLTNRFRKVKELNIMLLSKPRKENMMEEFDFSDLLKYRLDKLEYLKEQELLLNKYNNNGIELATSKYHVLDIHNRYVLNNDAVKLDIYNRLFNDSYLLNINIFNSSLYYYFEVREVFELEKGEKKNKDNSLIASFIDSYEIILQYLTLTNDYNYLNHYIGLTIDNSLIDLIKNNESFFNMILNRVKELHSFDIEVEENVSKLILPNNNYNKWIKKEQDRKIGISETTKDFCAVTLLKWNRQEDVIDMIRDSGALVDCKYKGEIRQCISANDIVDYFTTNKQKYATLINTDGEYDFKLEEKSIGVYFSLIERHITKIKLNYKGKRKTVYSLN